MKYTLEDVKTGRFFSIGAPGAELWFNKLACLRSKEYILIEGNNLQSLGEVFKCKSVFHQKHNIKLEMICNICHSSALGEKKFKN